MTKCDLSQLLSLVVVQVAKHSFQKTTFHIGFKCLVVVNHPFYRRPVAPVIRCTLSPVWMQNLVPFMRISHAVEYSKMLDGFVTNCYIFSHREVKNVICRNDATLSQDDFEKQVMDETCVTPTKKKKHATSKLNRRST